MTDLSELAWVFGHGSLMFDPGFDYDVALPGRAHGWERRFGQPSIRNWGWPESPAPTCSLTPGSHCDGVVFGVDPGRAESVMGALIDREASQPITVAVSTDLGSLNANTWVMGSNWIGATVEELVTAAVRNIAAGGGPSGDAWGYVSGVAKALAEHDLDDPLVTDYRDALAERIATDR